MALLLALPLAYVLSIGPVLYFMTKFHAPMTANHYAAAFYQPLIWMRENTSFKQPLDAYVGWWLEMAMR